MAYRAIPDERPTYDGAYGRDGAPASRVVRPLNPAYRPVHPTHQHHHHPPPQQQQQHPRQLHIDTSAQHHQRQLYSPSGAARVGGGMTYQHHRPSSPSPPPPSYHSSDAGHSPHSAYPLPPKAAFFSPVNEKFSSSQTQPLQPRPAAGGGGGRSLGQKVRRSLMWGQTTQEEKAAREFRGDEEPPAFWKRMSSAAHLQRSADQSWLRKQTGQSGKIKFIAWTLVLLVLGGVGGLIAWRVLDHKGSSSNTTSPQALSWANGATDVPSIFATATSSTPPTATLGSSRHKRDLVGRKFGRHLGDLVAPTPTPAS